LSVHIKLTKKAAQTIDRTITRVRNSDKLPKDIFSVTEFVHNEIEKQFDELRKDPRFNEAATRQYIDLLLSTYSIPQLYTDKDSLASFREEYIQDAEDTSLLVLNEFLNFFSDYTVMRTTDYKEPVEEIKKSITQSKLAIFNKLSAQEDINLASELIAYNKEYGKIRFFTCDKKCAESIRTFCKQHKISIGPVDTIAKQKPQSKS